MDMAAAPQTISDVSELHVRPSVAVDQDAATLSAPHVDYVVNTRLDWYIFGIMTGILIFLVSLLGYFLVMLTSNYQAGIQSALQPNAIDYVTALTYAQSSDATVMKISTLFLGFVLIFTGAIYVLRNATTQFKLQASGHDYGGGFETSSPGLVVVTLGVLLVGTALLSQHQIAYTPGSGPESKPAETIQSDAATAISPTPTLGMDPK
jgi:hypothetical protein